MIHQINQKRNQQNLKKLVETTFAHVALVKSTNNVVVNNLFYKGLRGFEMTKNM